MPFSTEFAAVKVAARVVCEDERSPATVLERESKATSEGEFTRVGTCAVENVGAPEVRPTSESFGKTR
jgi:hypothetical protein